MKKILSILVTAVFILTTTFTTAFAADDTTVNANAGITPDSILYPIDKLIEEIQLALTFNDVDKAKVLAQDAEERLAEVQVMMNEGKITYADTTATDYTKTVEQSNDIIQKIVDAEDQTQGTQVTETNGDETTTGSTENGGTVTTTNNGTTTPIDNSSTGTTPTDNNSTVTPPTDNSGTTNSALDELLKKNLELQKNSVNVLAALLNKLPEQSKEAVMAAIVKQIMRTEAVRDFVEAKKAYNDGRKDVHEAEKSLKDAEKSGDQSKIEAARTALDDANKKLQDLETAKKATESTKKDIKTLIDDKLKEIGIIQDDKKDTDEQDIDKDEDQSQTVEVNDIKDEIGKLQSRISTEIKNQQKEKAKERVEQQKEKIKEQQEQKAQTRQENGQGKGNNGNGKGEGKGK